MALHCTHLLGNRASVAYKAGCLHLSVMCLALCNWKYLNGLPGWCLTLALLPVVLPGLWHDAFCPSFSPAYQQLEARLQSVREIGWHRQYIEILVYIFLFFIMIFTNAAMLTYSSVGFVHQDCNTDQNFTHTQKFYLTVLKLRCNNCLSERRFITSCD